LGAGADQRSSLDIGQLVSLSHLRGAAPYGPPNENIFVQLYEASTGERLQSMELFRGRRPVLQTAAGHPARLTGSAEKAVA